MHSSCVVILFLVGLVYSQIDLISDPGLLELSGDQCDPSNQWSFRSDYVWNNTDLYVNPRCAAYLELPTPVRPGISKGDQTNINKALIPTIPFVSGSSDLNWNYSAGVVDMNTACRAALWAEFDLPHSNANVTIDLMLWVRSNDQIQQLLFDNSLVLNSTLLQYLPQPDGLLGEDTNDFPVIEEETNLVRVDIMLPQGGTDFYDRAFSVDPDQILVNIPIPGFADGNVVPAEGTNNTWISVHFDASAHLNTAGTYALRIASAQSQIGVSWGVTDVHVVSTGGVKRKEHVRGNTVTGLYEVESFGVEIQGEMTHRIPARMSRY